MDYTTLYTFIGDGDSSVHASLVTGVLIWGFAIKIILTEPMRRWLTKAARCAIKM